jgi:UDP-N-acetylmuramate: L-alanyl-gamma-D-glutamyl-meso-diaminopimelate ligase
MAAVLLKANGTDPGWLVCGVPRDLPDSSHPGKQGGPFVIEGDEYDTAFFDKRSKFIQYLPHVLAVNNCEFDHADIFRDLDDVLRTFAHVIRIVPRDGVIVANGDDANVLGLVKNVSWAPVVRVGTGAGNDAIIADFQESSTGSSFTLLWKGKEWGRVKWALPGLFNARNAAMAAVSAGLLLDANDPTKLKLHALDKFLGVQRRQQVLVDRADLTVIEDFGHHPTALDLTLESLRARYPKHRLVACFEPRSNTAARKVMQDGFREALKQADEVFLAPPHRADKLGEERFDSTGVAAAITAAGKKGFAPASNDALLAELTTLVQSDKSPRCVIFFSNGAFGGIIQKFAQAVA